MMPARGNFVYTKRDIKYCNNTNKIKLNDNRMEQLRIHEHLTFSFFIFKLSFVLFLVMLLIIFLKLKIYAHN